MKTVWSAVPVLLLACTPAFAHRLDEYLQATLLSVQKDRVHAQVRLIPGVAVLPIVLGKIDVDGNGAISDNEQRAYAARVLQDLSLTIDGDRLRLRLVSLKFPGVEEMKGGLGEIQLELETTLPPGGRNRKLVFENHHQTPIAAYLVNCLVPEDPAIRITAQNRNYQQSFYEVDYTQAGVGPAPRFSAWLTNGGGWLGMLALFLSARLAFLWRRHGSPGKAA